MSIWRSVNVVQTSLSVPSAKVNVVNGDVGRGR
jgi:hypothetical protein